ncbi:MAG: hypothetical protein KGM47_15450 [Acidobacteriota bacterium]|nr:hypothetical protein [Acidobacteriota bacterium]
MAVNLVIRARANAPPEQSRTCKIGSWVASTVPGFEEVRDFYTKLAGMMSWDPVPTGNLKGFVEVDWAPTVFVSSLRSRQKTEGAV